MKYIIAISLLCIYTNCYSQIPVTIQHKIDSLVAAKAIPGIIIGTTDLKTRSYYTAGFANKETSQLFDAATQVEIGSIGKTFTAYILTSVLIKNKISDSAFIGTYLPDSIQQNSSVANIRFVELMNHTAGLPRLPNNMGTPINSMQPYENYSEQKLFSYLKTVIITKNGKVNYSNLGAGLAGVLAERISRKSYEQLLKKYITKPFKMSYTQMKGAPNRVISIGYFNDSVATYWTMNSLKAAGGIKSDATDMLSYIEYLLKNDQSLVIQNITKPTAVINKRLQIAKGWHILSLPNNSSLYWHSGGTYGFSTFCAFHKETGKGIFIAVNAFNKNNIVDGIGIDIMSKMLDLK